MKGKISALREEVQFDSLSLPKGSNILEYSKAF
jgi:hypothetical protein